VRARQPEQKAERREHLLTTARAMLESGEDVRTLSLNALARRAKMTKSNVYRYFESREAVLLALLEQEWAAWGDDVRSALPIRQGGHKTQPEVLVARCFARTLVRRPLLCLLMSVLCSVVEQNVSEEVLGAFKRGGLEFANTLAVFVETTLPGTSRHMWLHLILDVPVVVTGLYPFAHPAPNAQRAMQDPELHVFRRSFERDVERFLHALAICMHGSSG